MGTEDSSATAAGPAPRPAGMTALVVLLFRVAAAAVALLGIVTAATAVPHLLFGSGIMASWPILLPGLGVVFVGALLWAVAWPVAILATRRIDPALPPCALRLPEAYAVVIVFLALLFLVGNLDTLLRTIPYLLAPPLDGGMPRHLMRFSAGLSTAYLVLDVAILLFAGRLGHGLAKLHGWRPGGTPCS